MLSYSEAVKYQPACILMERKAIHLDETEVAILIIHSITL